MAPQLVFSETHFEIYLIKREAKKESLPRLKGGRQRQLVRAEIHP
jgi:hypothetical protein